MNNQINSLLCYRNQNGDIVAFQNSNSNIIYLCNWEEPRYSKTKRLIDELKMTNLEPKPGLYKALKYINQFNY